MSTASVDHIVDPFSVAGLRIVVTGAAHGLGRAMADAYSVAGALVVGLDNQVPAEPISGWECQVGDIASESDVADFFDYVAKRLGGLDVLIANAGVRGRTAVIEELTLNDWQEVMAPNLDGQFLLTRAAGPLLRESTRARLIYLSSVAGRIAYPERGAYSTSKWGLIGLMKAVAREMGPDGVRVNAVLPGIVRSPGAAEALETRAKYSGTSPAEIENDYLSQTALGEWVEVDDIVNAVRFLASPAGAHIAGQSLSVCSFMESLRVNGK